MSKFLSVHIKNVNDARSIVTNVQAATSKGKARWQNYTFDKVILCRAVPQLILKGISGFGICSVTAIAIRVHAAATCAVGTITSSLLVAFMISVAFIRNTLSYSLELTTISSNT